MQESCDVVRDAKLATGLNQTDFAKILGKSQGLVSKYLNGTVQPKADVIIHCMNILSENKKTSDSYELLVAEVVKLKGSDSKELRKALLSVISAFGRNGH